MPKSDTMICMEPNINERLTTLEKKIDDMYTSFEKVRKYFIWSGIITLALIILPIIGLIFAVPTFLSTYSQINEITEGL